MDRTCRPIRRQPKVGDVHLRTRRVTQDVLRLQVTMVHSMTMHTRQTIDDLEENAFDECVFSPIRQCPGVWVPPMDLTGQVATRAVIHDHVGVLGRDDEVVKEDYSEVLRSLVVQDGFAASTGSSAACRREYLDGEGEREDVFDNILTPMRRL